MKKTALLLLLLIVVHHHCGKPTNPYKDPANVTMSVSAAQAADSCFLRGDTLRVTAVFSLAALIESIAVEIGTWDTNFQHDGSDTLRFSHPLSDSGTLKVTVAASLTDGQRDTNFNICVIDTGGGDTSANNPRNAAPEFTVVSPGSALKAGSADTLVFQATDGDGDTVTYSILNDSLFESGTISAHMYGDSFVVIFEPASEGVYTIVVVISDGTNYDSTTVTVTVDPADGNASPVFTTEPASHFALVGQIDTLIFRAADSDGDALTFSLAHESEFDSSAIEILTAGDSMIVIFSPTASDTTSFIAVVSDGGLTARCTTYVWVVEPDTSAPHIRIVAPSTDTTSVSGSSKRIDFVVTDNHIIGAVDVLSDNGPISVILIDDTTFQATVTGLVANTYTNVRIHASDSSGNADTVALWLLYDPTLTDEEPPAIVWDSGPRHNDRVKTGAGSITFSISDDGGLDSVYWMLDDVFVGVCTKLGGDLYEVSYDFGVNYGHRTVAVLAVDGSANRNTATSVTRLNYNTAISTPVLSSPIDGAAGLKSVTLVWTGGDDADGDEVTYKVWYGLTATGLSIPVSSGTAKEKALTGLDGNTRYYWQVRAYSEVYPEDSVSSEIFSFWTYNTPPTVSATEPVNATGVSRTPTFRYGATLGDNDPVTYDIWLGTTASLTSADLYATSLTATEYTPTLELDAGANYYWCVVATETSGAQAARDTSVVASFCTTYDSPKWAGAIGLSTYRNETAKVKLSTYLTSFQAGHALQYKLKISDAGVTLSNDSLYWTRTGSNTSTKNIEVIVADNVSCDPSADTTTLTVTLRTGEPAGMRYIPAGRVAGTTVGTAFFMDTTEVTQKAYTVHMPTKAFTPVGDNYPATRVTFYEAVIYCNELSKANFLDTCYAYDKTFLDSTYVDGTTIHVCSGLENLVSNSSKPGYRLPTINEWKYAYWLHSGKTYALSADFYWGNWNDHDQYSWTSENANGSMQPVAQKTPNAAGLYDLSGNIFEWIWTDDYCAETTGRRIDVGGSFVYPYQGAVGERPMFNGYMPNCWYGCKEFGDSGFRIVRTAQ